MFIYAKLLEHDNNKYRYAFGPDKSHLDGIVVVDREIMNNSIVEKYSEDLPHFAGMRIISVILHKMIDDGKVPTAFEYANS